MRSETNANEIKIKKATQQDMEERILYIVPLEVYDDSIITDEIDFDDTEDLIKYNGRIIQKNKDYFTIEINASKQIDKKEKGFIDNVHTALDIAGFVPAFGAIPDIANGIIYLCQGDFTNMGLSFVAAVPGIGDTIAAGSKFVKYGSKLAKSPKLASAGIKRFYGEEIASQAVYVTKKAKDSGIKKISMLWTNGTKYNAKAFIKEVNKIDPEIEIKMLETTIEGIQMEKKVNRILVETAVKYGIPKDVVFKSLKEGNLWNDFYNRWFKYSNHNKKLARIKRKCEKIQREISEEYADSISKDYLIRFRQQGKPLGQTSKYEQKVLNKAGKEVDDTISIQASQKLNREQYIHRNDR